MAAGARSFTFGHDDATRVKTWDQDNDHGNFRRTFGYDQYARLSSVQEGSTRRTGTSYNDGARAIVARSDLGTNGDQALAGTTLYDQLGRVRLQQDEAGNDVQTRYYTAQGGGASYELRSNPYVTGSESTMGWTVTERDTLGRVV